ncbi:response regulator [Inquilinus sp. KBS0705]|nr:response regulator [Inquilinus sp. KBS0705]
MISKLPFFNFSIKKVLAQEPDNLHRARIKIVYTTLLLWLLKLALIVPVNFRSLQDHQLWRASFVFVLYIGLTKLLLYRPQRINIISHTIILTGVVTVWTNLMVFSQSLNLVTIQLAFMVVFVGYYLIDSRFAIFYSALAIAPILIYLFFTHKPILHLNMTPADLPSPSFQIVVTMNFITMVLINYLFYRAFRDSVAEKEALNKQLEATIAETKALADSRSVFLSTMSHELRTPLNAVIGMTNLIKDTATPEQTENLDILEFSAMGLLTLVNDILDYNKSENDKIVLEAIAVNLPELLHKVCYGLQQKAAEKGFGLVLQVDDKLKDQLVVTDPTRLTQIIYNLAGNAIKFTERGEVLVKAMAGATDEESMTVHFSISDTGIGIPEDRQTIIFDPFVQASADTTRHYGGTGLGLAIVKRLIALFDSEIVLNSRHGEGSVFAFAIKLPLYKGGTNPIALQSALKNSLEGLRILIAEDNSVNALLLVKILTRWNINADIAVNGQEAVNAVIAGTYDVVLMDLHMPVMDGYQATASIRALDNIVKANIPIIALTASVSHNIHDKIKEAGMYDYMSKPFQPAALYQKLERLNIAKEGRTLA